jgi:tetratricopeptide (TPR) repeat protein
MVTKSLLAGQWSTFAVACLLFAPSLQAGMWQASEARDIGIEDPVERETYVAATKQVEPSVRAVELERFLKQYPSSVAKVEALDKLLDAYEKTGSAAKVVATADRLVQADPDNLQALFAKAKLFHHYDSDTSQTHLRETLEWVKRALRILDTTASLEGIAAADFDKEKRTMRTVLNELAGNLCFLAKDFGSAEDYLRAAVESDPSNFGNAYQLSLAYLSSRLPGLDQGLFFWARATNLISMESREKFNSYGKEQCLKYYDSDRAWPALMAFAKTHAAPPLGFTIDSLNKQ